MTRLFTGVALAVAFTAGKACGESIARLWNEQNLEAIRRDFPNPPVHARNLFHTSVAMWDAWAAYDALAVGYIHREKIVAPDKEAARHEAISYAAYRILASRYSISVDAVATAARLKAQMEALGYDPEDANVEGGSPAAVGNRVAMAILDFAGSDRSREPFLYSDFTYFPVNEPLVLAFSGTAMDNPNRWQPLAFDVAFTQNGLIASKVQVFVGSHWGDVRPFAMQLEAGKELYHDPGTPPQLGGSDDDRFRDGVVEVIRRSSFLVPDAGELIDISPAARGNNSLGKNDGVGYGSNPATGQGYAPNMVNHGDYGRVIAEFWADGPSSETPPGHWNSIANEVVDDPEFVRRIGGTGALLDALEWDVKMYFALNGAVHDAAIAAWGCKRVYDYVRPISSIRYCGGLGQSSDENLPSFHPLGLPIVPGLIEVVTEESSAPGARHEHLEFWIGDVAIYAWQGEPEDPETQHGGTGWIRAKDWLPYQRDTFVTPAFAGYVSGHSAFSRAAAEVLTAMTGSPYFPGGLGSYTEPAGGLEFESGPAEDFELQWATYFDAADEAGISRLYGGIHVPVDDGPGRTMGSDCGKDAWLLASQYFNAGITLEKTSVLEAVLVEDGDLQITWDAVRGMRYQVESSPDLRTFSPLSAPMAADSMRETFTLERPDEDAFYVRVVRVP